MARQTFLRPYRSTCWFPAVRTQYRWIDRAHAWRLNVVVDLQQRSGEALWQLAQHQHIGCAVDYGEQAIWLWMAASASAGASVGECSRDVLWQQLQRLALAKARTPCRTTWSSTR